MSRARFSVTFETVTPESAAEGEAAARGFIAERVTLREARDLLRFEGDACEASDYPGPARWYTFAPDRDARTGAETCKALHLHPPITNASAQRVARLFGYGRAR